MSHHGTVEGFMRFPCSWNMKSARQASVLRLATTRISLTDLPAGIGRLPIFDQSDAVAEAEIREGHRTTSLTSLAGRLRSKGLGETEIISELQRTNTERCHPPLPVQEVENIAKSKARYPIPATARSSRTDDNTGGHPVGLGRIAQDERRRHVCTGVAVAWLPTCGESNNNLLWPTRSR